MLINFKKNSPHKFGNLYVHHVCVIVHIDGKNIMYNFNEGDKFIRNMLVICDVKEVESMKEFIEANTNKMKFSKKKIESNQLSLF